MRVKIGDGKMHIPWEHPQCNFLWGKCLNSWICKLQMQKWGKVHKWIWDYCHLLVWPFLSKEKKKKSLNGSSGYFELGERRTLGDPKMPVSKLALLEAPQEKKYEFPGSWKCSWGLSYCPHTAPCPSLQYTVTNKWLLPLNEVLCSDYNF